MVWGLVAAAIGAGALFLVLSFVPAGGYAGYNVNVSVTTSETSFVVANYFAITSVSGQTTGASAIIPLNAWLSIAPPALIASFTETVCVGGSHCGTLTGSQFLPTVPFVNGASASATNQFIITGAASGTQAITVTLYQGQSVVATGSGSMCVNSGC